MSGTPARRGVGGFPTTPQTTNQSPGVRSPNGTTPRPNVRTPLLDLPRAPAQASSGPLIPSDILDPAQQRFYVFALYIALWAYRSYDFYTLIIEEDQSLWLCLKWCFIDMIFMFGVPLLEIPWLEWSNGAAFLLFVLHAALDVMLMFKIGIPVQVWFMGLVGFLWDSELAISERSVKPGAILHNASLILGKQIINILPEGSAILNPDKQPFCLSSTVTQLQIPILINQTEPIEMEILRIDVANNVNETIIIKKKELSNMLKQAKKAQKPAKSIDPADPLTLRYTIKKPGVYLLKKVLDHSKLQVRPRASSLIVATCPQARVVPTGDNRCRNDLSNVALEVEGTPPLSLKYRLAVNGKPRGGQEFQNLQPDDAISPLSRHTSQALVKSGREDVSWARSQKITVPLNETLLTSGTWEYEVEEVHDGLGNFVSFAAVDDEERPKHQVTAIRQSFLVHERPRAFLRGCSPQTPIRVAKNNMAILPVMYESTGKHSIDAPHALAYLFTPEADIVVDGYHNPNAQLKKQSVKSAKDQPLIKEAGLYTLKSVSTDFCEGEVLEPLSCLLQNPPEPGLAINSEDIVDKCAGNPIGLRVGFDLVGSPPFMVHYIEHINGQKHRRSKQIATLRMTDDFTPRDAGHYKYTFESISDQIYKDVPLKNLELQQNVRPSAQARFNESKRPKQACIDDTADFDLHLSGEGPWKLDYEVLHNGKRTKHSVETSDEHYTITTDKLKNGGEYVVTLTSISDKMGCKEFLQEEARVNVRHERPKAYFGTIDNRHTIMALEGRTVGLPLRFTGNGPWRLEFENLATQEVKKEYFQTANAFLDVKTDGTYHLLSVKDSVCPGLIEEKASHFDVAWVARPTLSIPEADGVVFEGGKYIKDAVCEGEEDAFDVSLSGNAPFDVSYRQENKDKRGKIASFSDKELHAVGGTTSIKADTSKAGDYEYTFLKLADAKYDHSKKHFSPLTIRQTVYSRPSARFDKPGRTYSYCSREAEGEEVIPITLEGVPPFHLEVEIKHQGTPSPEVSIHKNILDNKYSLKIERNKLNLGSSSIFIRKVRDSRGCTLRPHPNNKDRVQISVFDAPTATALEERTDFCVGERLSYALSGQAPFTVYYTFEGKERKASSSSTHFKRLAERPGIFKITGLRDSASECLATLDSSKMIHPIPSVRLSGGQVSEIDIHEGGGTDLEFDFQGTPPFEFTYTRSTNAVRGRKSKVLEVRTERSEGLKLQVPVQEEGTYEVVSIKDRWCGFAKEGLEGAGKGKGQKMLQY